MFALNPAAALVGAALAVSACSSPRSGIPQVREIYREAALREARNPVVVIHGILGSRLVDTEDGKIVWGAFTSDAIDPEAADGVRALTDGLRIDGGAMAYDPATARVQPKGPLGALEVGILFSVVNVEIYAGILRALGVGGYVDPISFDPNSPEYAEDHFTCHTFFYDWRRDNVENAIALGRFLENARGEIRGRAENKILELVADGSTEAAADARELREWLDGGFRFDVVAHSMGGLIARYFLRYGLQDLPADGSAPTVTWRGAELIDRLVMVGTPNFGAMDALINLVDGFQPAFILPYYHPAVLSMMPSIYQLLPRTGQGLVLGPTGEVMDFDLFDVEEWDRNGWGLLGDDADRYRQWIWPDAGDAAERRRRAKDHAKWCLDRARQFHAALDQDPETQCPVDMRLFAADAIDTITRTKLRERSDGTLAPTFDDDELYEPGDGTVPRYSAVADRRQGTAMRTWLDSPVPWRSVTFLPDDHVGITRNPLFTNNLLFFLLEQRPRAR